MNLTRQYKTRITESREQKFTQSVNLADEVRFKTPFDKALYLEWIFGVASKNETRLGNETCRSFIFVKSPRKAAKRQCLYKADKIILCLLALGFVANSQIDL